MIVNKQEKKGGDSFKTNMMKKYVDMPYLMNEISQNILLESSSTLKSCYRQMIRLRQMDTILQNAQRQGRISFYMCCRGEESIHFVSNTVVTKFEFYSNWIISNKHLVFVSKIIQGICICIDIKRYYICSIPRTRHSHVERI